MTVRDRIMIAHSLAGDEFGPAQRLHGATYVVEAGFRGEALDDAGVLVDIGKAASELRTVLADLDYRNLDESPAFAGRNSTTEVIAQVVGDALADRVRAGALGTGIASLVVTLRESDVAWVSYEAVP
ncbi:6-carboxytetrahydropterin synthase [Nocardioides sp. CER19]|uniref:6-pyruvoyl trahydropterin synthase family protein n=1 Tax=Nocardioides sp. CER19 TaxID=3038538 RepID=UPI00244BE98F|nr:6-carboxytetrahydropterin synthase [Nocardioides sp. CER19]MDH2416870.1 6-carboxytetrahydropterin synthase [Nocardioides sp. CER19]